MWMLVSYLEEDDADTLRYGCVKGLERDSSVSWEELLRF